MAAPPELSIAKEAVHDEAFCSSDECAAVRYLIGVRFRFTVFCHIDDEGHHDLQVETGASVLAKVRELVVIKSVDPLVIILSRP